MAKILVADDEPMVRSALTQILQSAGHSVIEAEDGLQAIKKYNAENQDLAIVDMYMPGQDGVETIRYFRKFAPQLRLIAITGNPADNVLAVAQHLGAVAVFQKPFEASELLKAVTHALQNKPAA